jgi:hypothetical protein
MFAKEIIENPRFVYTTVSAERKSTKIIRALNLQRESSASEYNFLQTRPFYCPPMVMINDE